MSKNCEKTCPLCAEEMDLTDQQLKPCKCGYEICVWCWHQIIDMAEKEDTEGRCPACRIPYDKEKIVGTAASCERMVAAINSERKKMQKSKSKNTEGRKHLSSVRVIQRNLAYVIGLPSNLASENILERKEYFGQYGKILKVSIARPTGSTQHQPNSTISVYITYTKEEEAVRCIQLVHGFSLEGQTLRACFGTTKYCHAWLRNMPCNNPDCLYLHELGAQEDSFTKDEIISAYSRSRVPQIMGIASNSNKRSGNILPPPLDDICISSTTSSTKTVVKSVPHNLPAQNGLSPPNCARRSSILPAGASWGLRGSNCTSTSVSLPSISEPFKELSGSFSSSSSGPHMSVAATSSSSSLDSGNLFMATEKKMLQSNARLDLLESAGQSMMADKQGSAAIDAGGSPANNTCTNISMPMHKHGTNSIQLGRTVSNPELGATGAPGIFHGSDAATRICSAHSDGNYQKSKSDMDATPVIGLSGPSLTSVPCSGVVRHNASLTSNKQSYFSLPTSTGQYLSAMDEDDSDAASRLKLTGRGKSFASPIPFDMGNSVSDVYANNASTLPDIGRNLASSESFDMSSSAMDGIQVDDSLVNQNSALELERSIISNILSLDLDSWDDPLGSSNKIAEIFNEHNKQNGSLGSFSPFEMKKESSILFTMSRDSVDEGNSQKTSSSNVNSKMSCSPQKNRGFLKDEFLNNFPVPSAPQVCAPPGFSFPCRVPPPGFSSKERLSRHIDTVSSEYQASNTSLSRSSSVTCVNPSGSIGDVEFIDPAILAIGPGKVPLRTSNMQSSGSSGGLSRSFSGTVFSPSIIKQGSSPTPNHGITGPVDGFINLHENRLLRQGGSTLQQVGQFSTAQIGSFYHPNGWNDLNGLLTGNGMRDAISFQNEKLRRFSPLYDELKGGTVADSYSAFLQAFGI